MYLMIAACWCNIWPRQRAWPLQSCRELLPMASPWLLSDCAGSGHPIHIGPCLSNWLDWLDPCDMAGCQGRVAHHYWAMMTNITGRWACVGEQWCSMSHIHLWIHRLTCRPLRGAQENIRVSPEAYISMQQIISVGKAVFHQ